MQENILPKRIYTNQFEHLSNGVKPIMTCIGTPDDFDHEKGTIFQRFDGRFKGVTNVDYRKDKKYFEKNQMSNVGDNTYVISSVDNTNKYSEGFIDCTSVIVSGIDKETGENISFLTHQYPAEFLFEEKDNFVNHLDEKLNEIKNRCKEGTIDAVLLGGNDFNDIKNSTKYVISSEETYLKSIALLTSEVKKILGFDPVIVNGPKVVEGSDDVYFDNKNRRVYFMRPKVNDQIISVHEKDFPLHKKEGLNAIIK